MMTSGLLIWVVLFLFVLLGLMILKIILFFGGGSLVSLQLRFACVCFTSEISPPSCVCLDALSPIFALMCQSVLSGLIEVCIEV